MKHLLQRMIQFLNETDAVVIKLLKSLLNRIVDMNREVFEDVCCSFKQSERESIARLIGIELSISNYVATPIRSRSRAGSVCSVSSRVSLKDFANEEHGSSPLRPIGGEQFSTPTKVGGALKKLEIAEQTPVSPSKTKVQNVTETATPQVPKEITPTPTKTPVQKEQLDPSSSIAEPRRKSVSLLPVRKTPNSTISNVLLVSAATLVHDRPTFSAPMVKKESTQEFVPPAQFKELGNVSAKLDINQETVPQKSSPMISKETPLKKAGFSPVGVQNHSESTVAATPDNPSTPPPNLAKDVEADDSEAVMINPTQYVSKTPMHTPSREIKLLPEETDETVQKSLLDTPVSSNPRFLKSLKSPTTKSLNATPKPREMMLPVKVSPMRSNTKKPVRPMNLNELTIQQLDGMKIKGGTAVSPIKSTVSISTTIDNIESAVPLGNPEIANQEYDGGLKEPVISLVTISMDRDQQSDEKPVSNAGRDFALTPTPQSVQQTPLKSNPVESIPVFVAVEQPVDSPLVVTSFVLKESTPIKEVGIVNQPVLDSVLQSESNQAPDELLKKLMKCSPLPDIESSGTFESEEANTLPNSPHSLLRTISASANDHMIDTEKGLGLKETNIQTTNGSECTDASSGTSGGTSPSYSITVSETVDLQKETIPASFESGISSEQLLFASSNNNLASVERRRSMSTEPAKASFTESLLGADAAKSRRSSYSFVEQARRRSSAFVDPSFYLALSEVKSSTDIISLKQGLETLKNTIKSNQPILDRRLSTDIIKAILNCENLIVLFVNQKTDQVDVDFAIESALQICDECIEPIILLQSIIGAMEEDLSLKHCYRLSTRVVPKILDPSLTAIYDPLLCQQILKVFTFNKGLNHQTGSIRKAAFELSHAMICIRDEPWSENFYAFVRLGAGAPREKVLRGMAAQIR